MHFGRVANGQTTEVKDFYIQSPQNVGHGCKHLPKVHICQAHCRQEVRKGEPKVYLNSS